MRIIETIVIRLYELLPENWTKAIGRSNLLKPFRKFALGTGYRYRKAEVTVKRMYGDRMVAFRFVGSIRTAYRAKTAGMENSLLRKSLEMLSSVGKKEGATVFDVGANVGYLSMVWANTVAMNGGMVYSFEPNPTNVECLSAAIKINELNNICLENVAVGRSPGSVDFFLSASTSNARAANSSVEKVTMKMISLDDYVVENEIANCHLIKLDTDGTEYEILLGAKKIIDRFSPMLIIETNDDQRIVDFVKDNGYTILNVDAGEGIYEHSAGPNIFCVKAT